MINLLVEGSIAVLGAIGGLAFLVNIIVETTKELKLFKDIPTKLYAVTVAIVVNYSCLVVYISENKIDAEISYFVLTFLASFVVAFLSINGWETFNELKERYMFGNKK